MSECQSEQMGRLVESLKAERDYLKARVTAFDSQHDETVDKLRAANGELMRDKERLNKLLAHDQEGLCIVKSQYSSNDGAFMGYDVIRSREQLDAALSPNPKPTEPEAV